MGSVYQSPAVAAAVGKLAGRCEEMLRDGERLGERIRLLRLSLLPPRQEDPDPEHGLLPEEEGLDGSMDPFDALESLATEPPPPTVM